MSVVRPAARRRWLVVAALVAVLCAIPVVIAALPAARPSPSLTPEALRLRIRAASIPYEGLVEARGSLGLPDLPGFTEAIEPLSGSTRMRVWYDSRSLWRVDVITPTGERSFLQSPESLLVWDYERNLRTRITGGATVRLPRATDLVPPELARRLLGAVTSADRAIVLPARRVAGVGAVGLRVVPSDPFTTVGQVEVWADPKTGLPVEVQLAPRGSARPVVSTRFLELASKRPAASALTPTPAPGVAESTLGASSLAFRLYNLSDAELPSSLAGQLSSTGPVDGTRTYGRGFATFAVLALPGRYGRRLERAARRAGAAELTFPAGTGLVLRTSLLTALLTQDSLGRHFVLAGPVSQDLLQRAAAELTSSPEPVGR